MKVSELFYRLSVGEFSNLALSLEGSGTIREAEQGKLIVYTNAALAAIYKRFVLITKELLIETIDHITTYHLRKEFAVNSESNKLYKYIIDTPGNQFTGDVVRVLEVWDALKQMLPLNDPGQFGSVFTPGPLILQVPEPINRNALSVIYQAYHSPLEFSGLTKDEVLAQDIDIPGFLEAALINHIAYKTYTHMNGQEHQVKAQEYISMYEAECTEIEDNDLVAQTQSASHSKLYERGFV